MSLLPLALVAPAARLSFATPRRGQAGLRFHDLAVHKMLEAVS